MAESRKRGAQEFVLRGSITSALNGEALERAMAAMRKESNAARLGRPEELA